MIGHLSSEYIILLISLVITLGHLNCQAQDQIERNQHSFGRNTRHKLYEGHQQHTSQNQIWPPIVRQESTPTMDLPDGPRNALSNARHRVNGQRSGQLEKTPIARPYPIQRRFPVPIPQLLALLRILLLPLRILLAPLIILLRALLQLLRLLNPIVLLILFFQGAFQIANILRIILMILLRILLRILRRRRRRKDEHEETEVITLQEDTLVHHRDFVLVPICKPARHHKKSHGELREAGHSLLMRRLDGPVDLEQTRQIRPIVGTQDDDLLIRQLEKYLVEGRRLIEQLEQLRWSANSGDLCRKSFSHEDTLLGEQTRDRQLMRQLKQVLCDRSPRPMNFIQHPTGGTITGRRYL